MLGKLLTNWTHGAPMDQGRPSKTQIYMNCSGRSYGYNHRSSQSLHDILDTPTNNMKTPIVLTLASSTHFGVHVDPVRCLAIIITFHLP